MPTALSAGRSLTFRPQKAARSGRYGLRTVGNSPFRSATSKHTVVISGLSILSQARPGNLQLTINLISMTPSWFPDGKRIAFQSNRTGKMEVWVMNADGSGQRQVTDAKLHQ